MAGVKSEEGEGKATAVTEEIDDGSEDNLLSSKTKKVEETADADQEEDKKQPA